ncbi:MAG: hypothetical protein HRK26_05550 [Rickettsiaceae bacterium H1]|nr:hypothetical protein [Rickettsiaceae bacterium H1]
MPVPSSVVRVELELPVLQAASVVAVIAVNCKGALQKTTHFTKKSMQTSDKLVNIEKAIQKKFFTKQINDVAEDLNSITNILKESLYNIKENQFFINTAF